ncbi:thiol:disulfide interchange protein DsbA/DsbL [Rheinheimera pleomorphica]|uniref:thiol:disulfide interchange protein DsbA/DsbL n=1 Tax=Rheinheimera pleomorphica TaxID=2703963 RepID=UPI00141F3453|nr:thiol:disulfide interchange protein DsbA/DsbL [Rheinheimera pleomorphica]
MKFLFATLLLLASQLSFASDSFIQDEHYQLLDTPVSQSAQVVEYFSYYCPFCYNFEPIVAELKKALPAGTPLHKVPVAFLGGNMAATVQRAHATAELLKVEDAFAAALFNQIHQQRKPPQNRSDIAKLFAGLGIAAAQLDAHFDSLPVNSMVTEYDDAVAAANIRSVPSFVVNNKYLVKISAVSSQQQFNALVNYLLSLPTEAETQ